MRENISEYDKFSGLERKDRKPSFLVIVLVGLLLLLACSLGYDNIVKPYLAKKKQQTEKEIVPTSQEKEQVTINVKDVTTKDRTDVVSKEIKHNPIPRNDSPTKQEAKEEPSPALVTSTLESTGDQKESDTKLEFEQPRNTVSNTTSKTEDRKKLSVAEILERKTHADVVEQAKRAGVSTEGSTSDILQRITHADVVKQAKRAGVSTEGSTSDILQRITEKEMEKYNY